MFAKSYSIFILLITWFRLIIALFQNKIPPKSTIGHAPPFGHFGPPPTFKIASGCLDNPHNYKSTYLIYITTELQATVISVRYSFVKERIVVENLCIHTTKFIQWGEVAFVNNRSQNFSHNDSNTLPLSRVE